MEGFHDLLGVDYSDYAITLAAKIAHEKNTSIRFQPVDYLDPSHISSLGRFDYVLDKVIEIFSVLSCSHLLRERWMPLV
jgi:hypothetical protein